MLFVLLFVFYFLFYFLCWTEKRTNAEVLDVVGEQRKMVDVIVQKKKKWIGHDIVLREEELMKEVIEGRLDGKRTSGRPRIGMLEELMDGSYSEIKRRVDNRPEWRSWVPRTCYLAEHL